MAATKKANITYSEMRRLIIAWNKNAIDGAALPAQDKASMEDLIKTGTFEVLAEHKGIVVLTKDSYARFANPNSRNPETRKAARAVYDACAFGMEKAGVPKKDDGPKFTVDDYGKAAEAYKLATKNGVESLPSAYKAYLDKMPEKLKVYNDGKEVGEKDNPNAGAICYNTSLYSSMNKKSQILANSLKNPRITKKDFDQAENDLKIVKDALQLVEHLRPTKELEVAKDQTHDGPEISEE